MPEWLAHILMLLAGLVVLGAGGEFLVRGAARLARILGVSALVVGLTVVAFGTSAPEAAVSVFASVRGSPDLAVGNVVGSNIANVLLILGLAAVVKPVTISISLLRLDGPVMIVAAGAFVALGSRLGEIGRIAGVIFLLGLLVYTLGTYAMSRRFPPPIAEHPPRLVGLGARWWYNAVLVALGVAGLVLGARLIVQGASEVAALMGISERVIGLTVVAVGTSLPELATTVVAARHNEPDLAVGNVVGSNIFNVLFVTGLAAVAHPLPVAPEIQRLDGPLMLGVCVLFYPLVWSGRRVTRWEGVLLLIGYAAYLAWTAARAAP
jgi:cation:H+ antiporter